MLSCLAALFYRWAALLVHSCRCRDTLDLVRCLLMPFQCGGIAALIVTCQSEHLPVGACYLIASRIPPGLGPWIDGLWRRRLERRYVTSMMATSLEEAWSAKGRCPGAYGLLETFGAQKTKSLTGHKVSQRGFNQFRGQKVRRQRKASANLSECFFMARSYTVLT